MPIPFKLGKRPAMTDDRVPRMSQIGGQRLPPPPSTANWYAGIGTWPMLMNDEIGDCVEAAILHCVQQFSTYAGNPLTPTDAECLAFYRGATGYDPANAATDQGSYVLGPQGVMQFWTIQGAMCGGKLTKVDKFCQIRQKNPTEWKQGIWLFGGLLVGLMLPESVFDQGYIWRDATGPVAGGHEVWVDGYQMLAGSTFYDFVSWGQRYRMSESFMLSCVDETICVIDDTEINTRGKNAAGLDLAQLTHDMDLMRRQA